MADLDSQLKEVYLHKPECVINPPDWLLSPKKIAEYKALPHPALVEIAGRDSVAAAVQAVEEHSFTDLIPTYVYTGTEYGSWTVIQKAVKRLSERLPHVRVHELLLLGSPGFWRALNGKFISELISKYGFCTICVGCHLYLHSTRIPLALTLGITSVISGERELHDGRIKINQIAQALDAYRKVAEDFHVQLLFPLRHMGKGEQIAGILGIEWNEGEDQPGCVMSSNYVKPDGSVSVTPGEVERYLAEFAVPCARKIIRSYIAGRVPNHAEIAAHILDGGA